MSTLSFVPFESFDWADDAIEEAEMSAMTFPSLESFDWADDAIEEAEVSATTFSSLKSFDWADDAIEEAAMCAICAPSLTTSQSFDWADDAIEEAEMSTQSLSSFQSFDWAEDAIEEAESLRVTNLLLNNETSNISEPPSPTSPGGSSSSSSGRTSPEDWDRASSPNSDAEDPCDNGSCEEAIFGDNGYFAKHREADNGLEMLLDVANICPEQTYTTGSDNASYYNSCLEDIVEESTESEVDVEIFTNTFESQSIPDIADEQSENTIFDPAIYAGYYFYRHTRYGIPWGRALEEERVSSMPKPKLPYDGEADLAKRMTGGKALQSKDICPRRTPFAEKLRLLKLGIEISHVDVTRSEFKLTKDRQLKSYRTKPSGLRHCWTVSAKNESSNDRYRDKLGAAWDWTEAATVSR